MLMTVSRYIVVHLRKSVMHITMPDYKKPIHEHTRQKSLKILYIDMKNPMP